MWRAVWYSSSMAEFFCLHPSLYLLVSWAWWDWPLTWLTNHQPSVLWHCWLGHLTRKIVSEMTYNVSSGTLNTTIPYRVWCPTRHILGYFRAKHDFTPPVDGVGLRHCWNVNGCRRVTRSVIVAPSQHLPTPNCAMNRPSFYSSSTVHGRYGA